VGCAVWLDWCALSLESDVVGVEQKHE
jgi:hypothetical protein